MGMKVRPISTDRVSAYTHVLAVESVNDIQIERLLEDGVEKRRVQIKRSESGTEEIIYENGVIQSFLKTENGLPLEERSYVAGELHERYEYTYSGRRLVGVLVFNTAGDEIQSTSYQQTDEGRVFRADVTVEDLLRTSLYRFDESHMYESWLGDGRKPLSTDYGSGILYRYEAGDLRGIERWTGGELTRIESVVQTDGGFEKVIEDLSTGRIVAGRYNRSGSVIEETVYIGEERIERTKYRYANGRLVESTRLYAGVNEQHQYEYDDEGSVIREIIYRDTVLEKVIVWTGAKERYEDVYRDGKATLRVFFESDQKIDEELLR